MGGGGYIWGPYTCICMLGCVGCTTYSVKYMYATRKLQMQVARTGINLNDPVNSPVSNRFLLVALIFALIKLQQIME